MSYDLLTEIKLSTSRFFRQRDDVYEHPPVEKWFNQDCHHCYNAFCVSKISKKNGGYLICFKCGLRPKDV